MVKIVQDLAINITFFFVNPRLVRGLTMVCCSGLNQICMLREKGGGPNTGLIAPETSIKCWVHYQSQQCECAVSNWGAWGCNPQTFSIHCPKNKTKKNCWVCFGTVDKKGIFFPACILVTRVTVPCMGTNQGIHKGGRDNILWFEDRK